MFLNIYSSGWKALKLKRFDMYTLGNIGWHWVTLNKRIQNSMYTISVYSLIHEYMSTSTIEGTSTYVPTGMQVYNSYVTIHVQ